LDLKCINYTLEDLLRHTLRKNQLIDLEVEALLIILLERLRNGTGLLILDGLDEIADPSLRICFCQQLEQIHIAFPNASIIATSRIVGYREMGYRIGRGFEHMTLADLSREEKDDFVRRW
jgi:predicted NACHT family NTPase